MHAWNQHETTKETKAPCLEELEVARLAVAGALGGARLAVAGDQEERVVDVLQLEPVIETACV